MDTITTFSVDWENNAETFWAAIQALSELAGGKDALEVTGEQAAMIRALNAAAAAVDPGPDHARTPLVEQ